jgi:hypothetical protein
MTEMGYDVHESLKAHLRIAVTGCYQGSTTHAVASLDFGAGVYAIRETAGTWPKIRNAPVIAAKSSC